MWVDLPKQVGVSPEVKKMVVKDKNAIFLFGRFLLISCHAVTGFQAEDDGMLSKIVSDHFLFPGHFDRV